MRARALRIAAWLSVLLGGYGIVAVASLWGLAAGAFSGGLGALIAGAVVTDPVDARTRKIAKIGLVLSGLALAVAAAIVLVIVVLER